MLQHQRDLLVAERGASMFQFLQGPLQWRGKQLLKLELRTGVKSAFGNDFFVAAKGHRADKGDEEAQAGERDVDEKMLIASCETYLKGSSSFYQFRDNKWLVGDLCWPRRTRRPTIW
jgi:hypothetical protein